MKYCAKCLYPESKPYITFNEEGLCSACMSHESKQNYLRGINWEDREKEFEALVLEAKAKNSYCYDALVPVSGGKDSIMQVHRLLKYDLRILAVNVDYGIKTDIGRRNLECIPNMGANLVIYQPELSLHKKLIRIGFEEFGDPDLMSHTLLYAYPLHLGLSFHIPLILLGENSAFEYGGDRKISELTGITRSWFSNRRARLLSRPIRSSTTERASPSGASSSDAWTTAAASSPTRSLMSPS